MVDAFVPLHQLLELAAAILKPDLHLRTYTQLHEFATNTRKLNLTEQTQVIKVT